MPNLGDSWIICENWHDKICISGSKGSSPYCLLYPCTKQTLLINNGLSMNVRILEMRQHT